MQEAVDESHWWMQGRARALVGLLDRLGIKAGSALDVGAGTGFWAERVKERFDMIAVVEPHMRDYREKLERSGLSKSLIVAGLPGPLPLENESFDFISCLDVIEHVDEDLMSAHELRRLLKPDGHLLLTVPAHPQLWSVHDEAVGHKRRYTKQTLEALLRASGFEVILLSPLNVWLYPVAAILRRRNKVGNQKPPEMVNRILSAVFGSEGHLIGKWPGFMKGLSLLALCRPAS